MDRDDFLEVLREQYANDINEAFLECEHDDGVDLKMLQQMIVQLLKAAQERGLRQRDFEELCQDELPKEVFEKLEFGSGNVAA